MKKTRKHTISSLAFVISLIVLSGIVAALVLIFAKTNSERITVQNRQYLEDASSQTAKRLDEILDNAMNNVVIVSQLYELQLDKPEFDCNLLNGMAEATPFDYIRFLRPDGISVAGSGAMVDCTDRECYKNGMNGQSGIEYCESSRFIGTSVFIFYTPLCYKGEIIGILNGILEADSLSDKLVATFFGNNSNIAVLLPDGTVAASSWEKESAAGHSQEISFTDRLIGTDERDKAMQALKKGEPYSFTYSGIAGEGIAGMTPIANGQFILVQTFPSKATMEITQQSNRDIFMLEGALAAVFVIYIALMVINTLINTRMLEDIAIKDGMTGLYNRMEMQSRINNQVDMSDNNNFCLIMMDIDNFKNVNDVYGHHVGDMVIKSLSDILKDECCARFVSGRWGGEEFMLMLPDTDILAAKDVAEYIRKTFEDTKYSDVPSQTISIGVTQARKDDTLDILCTRVDDALYAAKKSGKNRVIEKSMVKKRQDRHFYFRFPSSFYMLSIQDPPPDIDRDVIIDTGTISRNHFCSSGLYKKY